MLKWDDIVQKRTAVYNYNYNIYYNFTHYFDNANPCNRYYEPDYSYFIFFEYNNVRKNIDMGQDGLASECKIKKFIKDPLLRKEIYLKLRVGKAEFNLWPSHPGGINSCKALLFDDRLDYLLIDINNFYKILAKFNKVVSVENINEFKEKILSSKCFLKTSFVKDDTLFFLLSFETFNNFITQNGYEPFIKTNRNHELVVWDIDVSASHARDFSRELDALFYFF